jgi:hypothetical protein
MKTTRRTLLGAALGAAQLGLLAPFIRPRRARAQSRDRPSRLLTIYLSGGYTPQYMWCPLTDDEIARHISPPYAARDERVFYRPEDVIELAPGAGGYAPLRMARTWDPARPANRASPRPADGPRYLPLGYSWIEHGLAQQTAVVHGIDMLSASHKSGYIGAMSGASGGEYRAPAIQSVFANHLFDAYADVRPLPCVALSNQGIPNAFTLPSRAAASFVPDIGAVRQMLSDSSTLPRWRGLGARSEADDVDFGGTVVGASRSTPLERFSLKALRERRGRSTSGTDRYLEQLHDNYRGVSKALARNLVDLLEATPGVEHLPPDALFGGEPAYGMGRWGYRLGAANESFTDAQFAPTFDMALRLMKADLVSALHLKMPRFYFDNHSGQTGHEREYLDMRGGFDVIARFLGEMKQTVLPSGKTLLDDTLVVIFSEFARTWSFRSSNNNLVFPDDHWPITSVTFVGGGVAGNRMVGGFDLEGFSLGPRGKPVDVVEEDGARTHRAPRAADVVTTALRILGLEMDEFFIPGGYGEIVGIRAVS